MHRYISQQGLRLLRQCIDHMRSIMEGERTENVQRRRVSPIERTCVRVSGGRRRLLMVLGHADSNIVLLPNAAPGVYRFRPGPDKQNNRFDESLTPISQLRGRSLDGAAVDIAAAAGSPRRLVETDGRGGAYDDDFRGNQTRQT